MKRLLIIVPLAIAACHSKPTTVADNATANQVDAALAAKGEGLALTPGRWEMTATFKDIKAPGMSAEQLAQMKKQMMAHATTTQSCLTPEQARQPAGSFFAGDMGANCKYDHFAMSGGKLDSAITCHGEGGATQHMTMAGTYGTDKMHLDLTTTGSGGAGSPTANMSVVMSVDGKHSGACTGAEGRS